MTEPISPFEIYMPVDEAIALEAALAAFDRITAGSGPNRRELAGAPLLTDWRRRLVPVFEPVLSGTVEGHPRLSGKRMVATSRLLVLNAAGGWARTTNRFYRLGRCAEWSLSFCPDKAVGPSISSRSELDMNAPFHRRHGFAAGTSAPERLLCLDIETCPDRSRLPADWGARFPKPIWHRIVAISVVEAVIAHDADGAERYEIVACRSGGEAGWSEVDLLRAFWSYFAQSRTRVVTWNGRGFDAQVLVQRSLVHCLTARGWYGDGRRDPGYTHRYADTHLDLMDVMSDRGACQKLSLDEAAKAIDLPGKLGGHGSEVEAMVEAGNLAAVQAYCEADTLNLYGLYLRWTLLTGRTSRSGYDAAEADLVTYLEQERAGRPHLGMFLERWGGSRCVSRAGLARSGGDLTAPEASAAEAAE